MSDEKYAKEIEKFDRKLEIFVNECLENDLSEAKIYALIKSNIYEKASNEVHQMNRIKNVLRFLKILLTTLILSYLLTRNSYTVDMLKMIGRRMMIQIQPIYDWTEHYETNCLIKNSKYKGTVDNVLQCNLCESVERCELIDNLVDLNNLTFLVSNQRPTKVVVDANVMKNKVFDLTLKDLSDFYLNLSYEDKVCMFESNLNFGNVFNLMSEMSNQHLPVYAHFENCNYNLRKKIRTLYEIPDFMPMMLEFSRENWFLISFNNYRGRNYKKIDIATGTKLAVLIQIKGSNRIQLVPKAKCLTSGCVKIELTIDEKELNYQILRTNLNLFII